MLKDWDSLASGKKEVLATIQDLFDSIETTQLCLKAMNGMIETMKFIPENMKLMCSFGFLTATDMADWFVKELKMNFRDSHKLTGKIVKFAESKGMGLEKLSLKDLKKFNPKIKKSYAKRFLGPKYPTNPSMNVSKLKKLFRIDYRNSMHIGKVGEAINGNLKIIDRNWSTNWESYNYIADYNGNLVSFMNKFKFNIDQRLNFKAKVKGHQKNRLFEVNETRMNYFRKVK